MFGSGLVWSVAGRAGTEPRELQSAVDRFRAAVGEKDVVQARPFGELAGQGSLVRVVIKIREVNRLGRFAANDLDDARMGMAEGVDGDAPEKIEIFLAGAVKDVNATAMRQQERL